MILKCEVFKKTLPKEETFIPFAKLRISLGKSRCSSEPLPSLQIPTSQGGSIYIRKDENTKQQLLTHYLVDYWIKSNKVYGHSKLNFNRVGLWNISVFKWCQFWLAEVFVTILQRDTPSPIHSLSPKLRMRNPKIYSQQTKDTGGLMIQILSCPSPMSEDNSYPRLKTSRKSEFPLTQPFILFWPLTDWMMPTHIGEVSLLC